jgi:hypothetical protein
LIEMIRIFYKTEFDLHDAKFEFVKSIFFTDTKSVFINDMLESNITILWRLCQMRAISRSSFAFYVGNASSFDQKELLPHSNYYDLQCYQTSPSQDYR